MPRRQNQDWDAPRSQRTLSRHGGISPHLVGLGQPHYGYAVSRVTAPGASAFGPFAWPQLSIVRVSTRQQPDEQW